MSRSSAVTTMWAICGSVSFAAATPALVAPSAIITPVAMTIGLYMTSSLGVPRDQRPGDRRSQVTGSQRLRSPSVPTLEEESWNDLLSDRVQQWLFFGPPLRFFKNRSESATLYRILSTLRKGRRTRSPRLLAGILILPSTGSSNLSWLLGLELVCNGAGSKADLGRRSHDATSNHSRFPRPQAGGPHRPFTARPVPDQRFSRAVGGTDAPHGSRELELFNL